MKVGDYVSLAARAARSRAGFSVRVLLVALPERPRGVRHGAAPAIVLIDGEEYEVTIGDLYPL